MPARYEQLAKWINDNGWTRGAELGVFAGRTTRYLLANCPGLKCLHGVDVWDLPGFQEGPTKSGEKCRCQYCDETRTDRRAESPQQMRERMTAIARADNSRLILMTAPTMQAAGVVRDGSLDFVFIDADHSTEGVDADLQAWVQKLKPEGWLIGHDSNMASVMNAVRRHFDASVIEDGEDDHVWLVRHAVMLQFDADRQVA